MQRTALEWTTGTEEVLKCLSIRQNSSAWGLTVKAEGRGYPQRGVIQHVILESKDNGKSSMCSKRDFKMG